MKPGEHKYAPLCECCDKTSIGKSYRAINGRRRYLCAQHMAENERIHFYHITTTRLDVDRDRAEEDYKRNSGTPLERVIYNRELSFSEKLELI
jgi:hypothetical protein